MSVSPPDQNPIRVMIVDDDRDFSASLAEIIERTGLGRAVAVVPGGEECLEALDREPDVDVVLLDVLLPGMDGLETARRIGERTRRPAVVFVTQFDHYALAAFDVEAADYVVKSDDHEAFTGRVRRMLERVAQRRVRSKEPIAALERRVEDLAERLERNNHRAARGLLPVKDYDQGSIVLVPTGEITHVDRRDRQVLIHTRERAYRSTQSIERLAGRLEPEGFASINPGALVNLRHVEHLIPNGDGSYDVQLANAERTVLAASRNRSRELLKRFGV